LLGGTALAGCTIGGVPIPTWITGLRAIAKEVQLVLPQLQAVGLIGNAALNVGVIADKIVAAIGAIGDAATLSQGQSVLTAVETYINALAPLVAPFVALVPGGAIISLIVAALPELEVLLNLAVTVLTPPTKALMTSAPRPAGAARGVVTVLTPNEALAELMRRAKQF
jgi:hypothetical protein